MTLNAVGLLCVLSLLKLITAKQVCIHSTLNTIQSHYMFRKLYETFIEMSIVWGLKIIIILYNPRELVPTSGLMNGPEKKGQYENFSTTP